MSQILSSFIEKSKQFLLPSPPPSYRRNAVNHVGWVVQRYKDGRWQNFGRVYHDKEVAINALIDWQAMFQGTEFRVYEEVK